MYVQLPTIHLFNETHTKDDKNLKCNAIADM